MVFDVENRQAKALSTGDPVTMCLLTVVDFVDREQPTTQRDPQLEGKGEGRDARLIRSSTPHMHHGDSAIRGQHRRGGSGTHLRESACV